MRLEKINERVSVFYLCSYFPNGFAAFLLLWPDLALCAIDGGVSVRNLGFSECPIFTVTEFLLHVYNTSLKFVKSQKYITSFQSIHVI